MTIAGVKDVRTARATLRIISYYLAFLAQFRFVIDETSLELFLRPLNFGRVSWDTSGEEIYLSMGN